MDMKYVAAASTSELANGVMKAVDIDGRELLLAKIDDAYYALSRRCTHMAENLCQGKLDGRVVTCPRHGARFDLTNGKAVGKAKLLFMSTTPADLATYPVKIDGAEILIGLP
jgi:3-phenylpropionate/trans-cinnamate dioxygenase ferredoxin subunit